MGMILDIDDLQYRLPNGRTILNKVSFKLGSGQVICILGPNGVGKSTLLRCIAGLDSLSGGRASINGQAIARLSRTELGRLVGLVPQSDTQIFAFTVREMVEMGRAAHIGWMSVPSAKDRLLVEQVLERLGIAGFADRLYPELSGGERQLVLIARALAQQPRLLILDEPTSHLDFANGMRVLELIRNLADEGLAILMTSHNPDHAFLVAESTLIMAPAQPAAFGQTRALLTEDRLSAAYGRAVRMISHNGRTLCFSPTDLAARPASAERI